MTPAESGGSKQYLAGAGDKVGGMNMSTKSGSIEDNESDAKTQPTQNVSQSQMSSLSLTLPTQELLPIAEEEKDSPSGTKAEPALELEHVAPAPKTN